MAERDPRKDPKVGDVFREREFLKIEVVAVGDKELHYLVSTPEATSPILRIPISCHCSRYSWPKRAKEYEVLHAAD